MLAFHRKKISAKSLAGIDDILAGFSGASEKV
jgi:hypothetical protein